MTENTPLIADDSVSHHSNSKMLDEKNSNTRILSASIRILYILTIILVIFVVFFPWEVIRSYGYTNMLDLGQKIVDSTSNSVQIVLKNYFELLGSTLSFKTGVISDYDSTRCEDSKIINHIDEAEQIRKLISPYPKSIIYMDTDDRFCLVNWDSESDTDDYKLYYSSKDEPKKIVVIEKQNIAEDQLSLGLEYVPEVEYDSIGQYLSNKFIYDNLNFTYDQFLVTIDEPFILMYSTSNVTSANFFSFSGVLITHDELISVIKSYLCDQRCNVALLDNNDNILFDTFYGSYGKRINNSLEFWYPDIYNTGNTFWNTLSKNFEDGSTGSFESTATINNTKYIIHRKNITYGKSYGLFIILACDIEMYTEKAFYKSSFVLIVVLCIFLSVIFIVSIVYQRCYTEINSKLKYKYSDIRKQKIHEGGKIMNCIEVLRSIVMHLPQESKAVILLKKIINQLTSPTSNVLHIKNSESEFCRYLMSTPKKLHFDNELNYMSIWKEYSSYKFKDPGSYKNLLTEWPNDPDIKRKIHILFNFIIVDNDFLFKPIDPDLLLDFVNLYLDEYCKNLQLTYIKLRSFTYLFNTHFGSWASNKIDGFILFVYVLISEVDFDKVGKDDPNFDKLKKVNKDRYSYEKLCIKEFFKVMRDNIFDQKYEEEFTKYFFDSLLDYRINTMSSCFETVYGHLRVRMESEYFLPKEDHNDMVLFFRFLLFFNELSVYWSSENIFSEYISSVDCLCLNEEENRKYHYVVLKCIVETSYSLLSIFFRIETIANNINGNIKIFEERNLVDLFNH